MDKEIARLETELERVKCEIERANARLSNSGFTEKAPAHLVEAEREKVRKYAEMKEKLEMQIKEFKE